MLKIIAYTQAWHTLGRVLPGSKNIWRDFVKFGLDMYECGSYFLHLPRPDQLGKRNFGFTENSRQRGREQKLSVQAWQLYSQGLGSCSASELRSRTIREPVNSSKVLSYIV